MDPSLTILLVLTLALLLTASSKSGRRKAKAVFGTLVRGPKGELTLKLAGPKKKRRKRRR